MPTPQLFAETIAGWDDWGEVYQSIPAFAPLVRRILEDHGLPQAPLRHLTPGTNAVFAVGELVVKIYAPAESGIGPEGPGPALPQAKQASPRAAKPPKGAGQPREAPAWVAPHLIERAGLRHAHAAGVPAPRILAEGTLRDKYAFPYLVLTLVPGREASAVLPGMGAGQKRAFAAALRRLTAALNVPPAPEAACGLPDDLIRNVAENERWSPFPPALRREALAAAKALDPAAFVFTHGDLTGENVLIDDTSAPHSGHPISRQEPSPTASVALETPLRRQSPAAGAGCSPASQPSQPPARSALSAEAALALIDFGDCHAAPPWYEWPPLCFELFRFDPVLMAAYFGEGEAQSPAFAATLTAAIALHDFGGDFALQLCRQTCTRPAAVNSLAALNALAARRLAQLP